MKYIPDTKHNKSIDLIENFLNNKELPRSMKNITNEEKIELLVYNILKHEEANRELRNQVKEYQEVFNAMSKFIMSNVKIKPWLLNWTSFVMRNTQAEFEEIKYEDGPEWIELMWNSWLNNSDLGRKKLNKINKKC
jgi:hypothetical protein